MKDILEFILKYVPAYLNEFIAVAVSPWQFMATRNRENINHNLTNALAFLGITLCFVWLLQAPLINKDEFFSRFVSAIIHMLIIVVVFSALLRLCWKIVGGKADFKPFLITYCYFTGVVTFILVIFKLVGSGLIKMNAPEFYRLIMSNDRAQIEALNVYADHYVIIGSLVQLGGILVSIIWLAAAWGAYRQLNQLSKTRSVVAYLLFVLFSSPVLSAFYFIAVALN
jgi:hypothetical protein